MPAILMNLSWLRRTVYENEGIMPVFVRRFNVEVKKKCHPMLTPQIQFQRFPVACRFLPDHFQTDFRYHGQWQLRLLDSFLYQWLWVLPAAKPQNLQGASMAQSDLGIRLHLHVVWCLRCDGDFRPIRFKFYCFLKVAIQWVRQDSHVTSDKHKKNWKNRVEWLSRTELWEFTEKQVELKNGGV